METILLESKGPVAWVWLNRPHRLNAVNQTTLVELHRLFEDLDGDETVKAIILTGRGKRSWSYSRSVTTDTG